MTVYCNWYWWKGRLPVMFGHAKGMRERGSYEWRRIIGVRIGGAFVGYVSGAEVDVEPDPPTALDGGKG